MGTIWLPAWQIGCWYSVLRKNLHFGRSEQQRTGCSGSAVGGRRWSWTIHWSIRILGLLRGTFSVWTSFSSLNFKCVSLIRFAPWWKIRRTDGPKSTTTLAKFPTLSRVVSGSVTKMKIRSKSKWIGLGLEATLVPWPGLSTWTTSATCADVDPIPWCKSFTKTWRTTMCPCPHLYQQQLKKSGGSLQVQQRAPQEPKLLGIRMWPRSLWIEDKLTVLWKLIGRILNAKR